MSILQHIRIVLLETSHPGNIGAAARAMKTMGLRQLVLVNPKYFPHAEATARAAGAEDILEQARVVTSLADAIKDCHWVVGTASFDRRLPWPVQDARTAALELVECAKTSPCAILFGTERTGLSNADLQRCHQHVKIPTDAQFASLNLAAAVQVLAYECHMAMLAQTQSPAQPPTHSTQAYDALATHAQLEGFYQHLQQVLIQLDFLDPQNPRHIMARLRRLLGRARVEHVEINILRGIMSAIEKKMRVIVDE